MTVELGQVLQVVQLVILLGGFAGLTFSIGRVFGRIERLEVSSAEVKAMLSGGDDGNGIFLRRSEARLIQENETQVHAAFDQRLQDFGSRLGACEERGRPKRKVTA